MRVGYIRVSTTEQNTIRQEKLMKILRVEEVFIDKVSGKSMDRPELKRMLDFIRKGDVVVVESISRLGRNTRDLLDIVSTLTEKDVTFISQKENIDTTTATGKFMITVFAAVSELERDYILQRQREGIEIAKQQGKYIGRKKIPIDYDNNIIGKWQRGEIPASEASKKLGISRSTFYRRVYTKIDN